MVSICLLRLLYATGRGSSAEAVGMMDGSKEKQRDTYKIAESIDLLLMVPPCRVIYETIEHEFYGAIISASSTISDRWKIIKISW